MKPETSIKLKQMKLYVNKTIRLSHVGALPVLPPDAYRSTIDWLLVAASAVSSKRAHCADINLYNAILLAGPIQPTRNVNYVAAAGALSGVGVVNDQGAVPFLVDNAVVSLGAGSFADFQPLLGRLSGAVMEGGSLQFADIIGQLGAPYLNSSFISNQATLSSNPGTVMTQLRGQNGPIERWASTSILNPSGQSAYAVNCGISIQGGGTNYAGGTSAEIICLISHYYVIEIDDQLVANAKSINKPVYIVADSMTDNTSFNAPRYMNYAGRTTYGIPRVNSLSANVLCVEAGVNDEIFTGGALDVYDAITAAPIPGAQIQVLSRLKVTTNYAGTGYFNI